MPGKGERVNVKQWCANAGAYFPEQNAIQLSSIQAAPQRGTVLKNQTEAGEELVPGKGERVTVNSMVRQRRGVLPRTKQYSVVIDPSRAAVQTDGLQNHARRRGGAAVWNGPSITIQKQGAHGAGALFPEQNIIQLSSKPCCSAYGYETMHHAGAELLPGKGKNRNSKARGTRHRCALSRTERYSVVNQAVSQCVRLQNQALHRGGESAWKEMPSEFKVAARKALAYSFQTERYSVVIQAVSQCRRLPDHARRRGGVPAWKSAIALSSHDVQVTAVLFPEQNVIQLLSKPCRSAYGYQTMHYAGAELLPGKAITIQ